MRYLFALLLIAGFIVWFAPPSVPYVQNARDALASLGASVGIDEQAFRERLAGYRSRLREKTMELIRDELHEVVDGLVR